MLVKGGPGRFNTQEDQECRTLDIFLFWAQTAYWPNMILVTGHYTTHKTLLQCSIHRLEYSCNKSMLPWQLLLRPLSWCPIFKSSHCNSFEDRAPVDFIYGCPIFKWVSEPYLMTYSHGLTWIPAWINKCIHHKVWDESTYPLPNFNGATIEVREWISNFVPHFFGHGITYPYRD